MTNEIICAAISKMEPAYNQKYIAEICVEEGYGQNCGGYLKGVNGPIEQKEHFLNYYMAAKDKEPTYQYLRCPQLLLFIAEVLGVPRECIENGYTIIKKYESPDIKESKKDGNYMWKRPELASLKKTLHIYELVKILRDNDDFDVAIKKIKEQIS